MAIENPRKYQLEVLESVLVRNTLVFLPTGSGKTLISVLFIKDRLYKIRRKMEYEMARQIVIFVAPTKVLCNQQKQYIANNSDGKVGLYTGDKTSNDGRSIDIWNQSDWVKELKHIEVLVCTPEILRQLLERNIMSVETINCVILDECHHAFGNNPMAIACELLHSSSKYKPHMLGMTASPLSCKKGSIISKILELEKTTRCKLVAPRSTLSELKEIIPVPKFFLLRYPVVPYHLLLSENICNASLSQQIKSKGWSLSVRLDTEEVLLHAYFRIRHASYISDIYGILSTLDIPSNDVEEIRGLNLPDHASLLFESSYETFHSIKNASESLWDTQQIIGQTLRIEQDCGVLCALHAFRISLDPENCGVNNTSPLWNPSAVAIKVKKRQHQSMAEKAVSMIDLQQVASWTQEIICHSPFGTTVLVDIETCMHSSLLECFAVLACMLGPTRCAEAAWVIRALEADRLGSVEDESGTADVSIMAILDILYALAASYKDPRIEIGSLGLAEALYRIPPGAPLPSLLTLKHAMQVGCRALLQTISSAELLDKVTIAQANVALEPFNIVTATATASNDTPGKLAEAAATQASDPLLMTPKVQALFQDLLRRCPEAWDNAVLEANEFNNNVHRIDNSQYECLPTGWAAIVFCKMRLAAVSLTQLLLSMLTTGGEGVTTRAIRPQFIIGSSNQSSQVDALKDFSDGVFNVLFATEVAEEGLDVRSCQLVVNFDAPSSVKSFIQRRGRARAANSHMTALIPNGPTGTGILSDLVRFCGQEEEMERHSQGLGSSGDGSTSTMRDVLTVVCRENGEEVSDDDEEDANDEMSADVGPNERYTVSTTGSSVDIRSSTALLFKICQGLPHDAYFLPRPIFHIVPGYRCAVLLPASLPPSIRCIIGPVAARKYIAKSLAALECVRQLHMCGELDDWLRPVGSSSNEDDEETVRDTEDGVETLESKKDVKVVTPSVLETDDTLVEVEVMIVPDVMSVDRPGTLVNSSGVQLYLYAFSAWASDNDLEKRTCMMSCDSCGNILRYLNRIGIALLYPMPVDSSDSVYDMSIRGRFKVSGRYDSLGSRNVSLEELGQMQRFHKSVLCWEEDKGSESYAESAGAFENWASGGNGAWYVVFPLPENMASHCDSDNSHTSAVMPPLIGSMLDSWWSLEYFTAVAAEAQTLVTGLLGHRESQKRESDGLQTVSKQNHNAKDIEGFLLRRGPTELFVGVPGPSVRLTDIMDARKAVTFYDYLKSKHGIIAEGLDDLLALPDHSMIRVLSVSGRLALIPLLRCLGDEDEEGCDAAPVRKKKKRKADEKENPVHNHASIVHLIPEYCQVVGRAAWYYIGTLAPAVCWRLQSIMLAAELRETMVDKIKPLQEKGLLRPLIVPGDGIAITTAENSISSVAAVTTPTVPYFPRLRVLAEAITPRMTYEFFNSERIEMLGDSLLKFGITVELFKMYPDKHEGGLTQLRMQFISNSYLTKVARRHNLVRFLRPVSMSTGKQKLIFTPSGLSLECLQAHEEGRMLPDYCMWNTSVIKSKKKIAVKSWGDVAETGGQSDSSSVTSSSFDLMVGTLLRKGVKKRYIVSRVRRKVLADLVEAVIGSFYVDGGVDGGIAALKALDIWPSPRTDSVGTKTHSIRRIREAPTIPEGYPKVLAKIAGAKDPEAPHPPEENICVGVSSETVDALQTKLGYRFRNMELLEEALTHCSCPNKTSNQRLEFLGDAVLDFAVVTILYHSQAWASDGDLSIQKSNATCNRNLGIIATRLGLHRYLNVMSTSLMKEFAEIEKKNILPQVFPNYSSECEAAETEISKNKHKASAGGALADFLEALIGAIFIDSGGSLDAIIKVVETLDLLPQINP